jgi:hypothetical protein
MPKEKAVREELRAKVKALKKRAEEFRKQGDLSRAENCLFLARYLEDFLGRKESSK